MKDNLEALKEAIRGQSLDMLIMLDILAREVSEAMVRVRLSDEEKKRLEETLKNSKKT